MTTKITPGNRAKLKAGMIEHKMSRLLGGCRTYQLMCSSIYRRAYRRKVRRNDKPTTRTARQLEQLVLKYAKNIRPCCTAKHIQLGRGRRDSWLNGLRKGMCVYIFTAYLPIQLLIRTMVRTAVQMICEVEQLVEHTAILR